MLTTCPSYRGWSSWASLLQCQAAACVMLQLMRLQQSSAAGPLMHSLAPVQHPSTSMQLSHAFLLPRRPRVRDRCSATHQHAVVTQFLSFAQAESEGPVREGERRWPGCRGRTLGTWALCTAPLRPTACTPRPATKGKIQPS